MDLKGIFSIAGKPGLYKLITQSKSGVIVENIEDGKKVHADANARISSLEDITIYSETEDVPLKDILEECKEHFGGKECGINLNKEADKMVSAFEEVLPNYDKERVYNYDIKKIFKWYNTLLAANLLEGSEEVEEEKVETEEEA